MAAGPGGYTVNNQPIEKRSFDPLLQVHSIFKTIQGEGPFCGVPCVFVRLAGCNLQCPACDTQYTDNRDRMTAGAVLDAVKAFRQSGLVVITGGEPFRQADQLAELFGELCGAGYYVQVETNGTLQPTVVGLAHRAGWRYSRVPSGRNGVYVVCSPKTGKIHPDIYKVACALKYVVRAGQIHTDGLPLNALDHPSNPYPARPPADWNRPVYVQPLDSKDNEANRFHTAAAVASCLRHGYTLQLQIHKFLGVE